LKEEGVCRGGPGMTSTFPVVRKGEGKKSSRPWGGGGKKTTALAQICIDLGKEKRKGGETVATLCTKKGKRRKARIFGGPEKREVVELRLPEKEGGKRKGVRVLIGRWKKEKRRKKERGEGRVGRGKEVEYLFLFRLQGEKKKGEKKTASHPGGREAKMAFHLTMRWREKKKRKIYR